MVGGKTVERVGTTVEDEPPIDGETGSTGWARRQERTRDDIVVAARGLISSDGLDGLTMRRLGAAAGVSVATLYNQFGDRQGVLAAIVAGGLDQMETVVEQQVAAHPLDTTRLLFEALDEMISGAVDVWRPVFTILQVGPVAGGLQPVADRAVRIIARDLDAAAEAGLLIDGVDLEVLALHILTARVNRLEKWATGVIEWEAYEQSSSLGLELLLAAVLADPVARSAALAASGVLAQPAD